MFGAPSGKAQGILRALAFGEQRASAVRVTETVRELGAIRTQGYSTRCGVHAWGTLASCMRGQLSVVRSVRSPLAGLGPVA